MNGQCNHDGCERTEVVDWGVCVDHYKEFVDKIKEDMGL